MQERIDRSARTCRYHFDNLPELGRYAETAPRTWGRYCTMSTDPNPRSWDLGAGYDGAVRMAKEGWLEGAAKTQEALKLLPLRSPAAKREINHYGHMPHMGRYVAGAIKHMVHKRPVEGRKSVLTLIVPVNAVAHVEAAHMANFGLAVTHYIAQLERAGTRVELLGAIHSISDGWTITHTWLIKHASQPLDLAVTAFTIGHPAMFRRLGFALRERCAAPSNSSYGRSIALTQESVINCPPGAIILNGMKDASTVARTPEAAVEYVTKYIDEARKGRTA